MVTHLYSVYGMILCHFALFLSYAPRTAFADLAFDSQSLPEIREHKIGLTYVLGRDDSSGCFLDNDGHTFPLSPLLRSHNQSLVLETLNKELWVPDYMGKD